MTIRRATPQDLETVRELWTALYEEAPEPEHERKDWHAIADDVRRGIAEHVALIAEEDGAAIGFLLARPRSARVGYVSDLYVRPGHRRRGVARALLREAVRCLDREVVTLDVDAGNSDARGFYSRLGFQEQSVRLVVAAEKLA